MHTWKRYRKKEEIIEKIGLNEVPYLAFKTLDNTNIVKHGFSTRLGGVSSDYFSSMNLSTAKGDSRDNVLENFKRITTAMDIDLHSLCLSYQVHSNKILKVDSKARGFGIDKPRPFDDVDALITNSKDITLVCFFADCIPIFLLDTKNKAIALAHAGWRGTVSKIAAICLNKMEIEYNSKADNIIACIGPGISKGNYEVSSDVYNNFYDKFDKKFIEKIFEKNHSDKYQLDLLEANKQILLEAGVAENNIHLADICTYDNSEYLFSHRKHGDKRGNMAAFLAIK